MFPLFSRKLLIRLCAVTPLCTENRSRRQNAECVRQCQFRKSNRAKCRSYTSFIEKLIRRPTSFSRVYLPLSVSSTFSASSRTSRRRDGRCLYAFSALSELYAHAYATRKYICTGLFERRMKKRFDRATNHSLSFSFSRPFCLPLLGFRIPRALPRATSLRLFPVHPELSIRDFYFAMPSGCRSVL